MQFIKKFESSNRKLILKDVIDRFNKIHNNKYDYSLVDSYKNNKSKIKIICPIHGEFEQIPQNHFKGQGCPICADKVQSKLMQQFSFDDFKTKASKYTSK